MKYKIIIAVIFLFVLFVIGFCIVVKTVIYKSDCAKKGETISMAHEPTQDNKCCPGLDTSGLGGVSIADKCYFDGKVGSGSVQTCIKCGDGKCDEYEDVCKCPKDCVGKNMSDFKTVSEYCDSSLRQLIDEGTCTTPKWFGNDLKICDLCTTK